MDTRIEKKVIALFLQSINKDNRVNRVFLQSYIEGEVFNCNKKEIGKYFHYLVTEFESFLDC